MTSSIQEPRTYSFTFGSFRPLLTNNSKQVTSDVKISENSLYFSPRSF